jgi:hypothetical protein
MSSAVGRHRIGKQSALAARGFLSLTKKDGCVETNRSQPVDRHRPILIARSGAFAFAGNTN